MLSVMYVYYIIKLVDLIDTVLFSLRKKSNQISFLHVFHHFSMVVNSWLGVKYVGGGQSKIKIIFLFEISLVNKIALILIKHSFCAYSTHLSM